MLTNMYSRYNIYFHIESYKNSRYSHNKRKGKQCVQHVEVCHGSLNDHSGLRVWSIQRTVLLLTQTVSWQSVWSLNLPWGPRDLFWLIIKILSEERGLLLSLGIKESKSPGFREPTVALVPKEHFTCFLLKAQKALWWSITLSFLLCLSHTFITWPVGILGGSYK